jgi:hypothetical protein
MALTRCHWIQRVRLNAPQQVAVALIVYLTFIELGEIRNVSYWHLVGVPAIPQVKFADLRVITAAWDCARRGLDPLVNNPCDPFHRPMNYPRIWLQIGLALQLGSRATVPIGIGLMVLFASSMILLARWIPPHRAWILLVLVLSPTWMTVVERGNNDIVVLALVTLALSVFSRPGLQRLAVVFCGVAALLKVYPLVTLLPWLRTRAGPWLFGVTSLVFAYLALTLGDLKSVAVGTPEPLYFAFGARTLGLDLVNRHIVSASVAWMLTATVVAAVLSAGVTLGLKLPPAQVETTFPVRMAFLTGSALYLAIFVANSNSAYRLIILSLTVPYLVTALSSDVARVRRLGSITLLAAVGVSWGLRVNSALPLTAFLAALLFVLLLGQGLAEWRSPRMSSAEVPRGASNRPAAGLAEL